MDIRIFPLEKKKYITVCPSIVMMMNSHGPRNQTVNYKMNMCVCHAEMNAILNKNSADVRGCTIYVGLFPCNECAKIIIQSGIKEVIYLSDKHAHKIKTVAAKKMFDAAGITYSQYTPKKTKIVIEFSEINWNEQSQVPPTPIKRLKHEND